MKIGISMAAALLLTSTSQVMAAPASETIQYKVTITNITKGISFTPFIAAAHKNGMRFFKVGEPASEEIVQIAEGGNIMPLYEKLSDSTNVYDIATSEGLLGPGESISLDLTTSLKTLKKNRLSLSAMLLPTNDTLVGLNNVRLPYLGTTTYFANAYDGGSENNDELCVNIPGPTCGGAPFSPEDPGEGYVYPSPTIHGEGDLSVESYGWTGPVAKVSISRMW